MGFFNELERRFSPSKYSVHINIFVLWYGQNRNHEVDAICIFEFAYTAGRCVLTLIFPAYLSLCQILRYI